MTGHCLDLSKYWAQHQLGDLTIYLTWLRTDEQEEPAMVLVPTYHRREFGHIAPCCIALSAAYRYSDPAYLAPAAHNIALTFGWEATAQRCMKIGEAIMNYIDDLYAMPPEPMERGAAVGEATVAIDGKLHGKELYEEH